MRKYSIKFLLLSCLVSAFLNVNAQSGNVTISGFITDAYSGDPLIGTNILLYKDSIDVDNPPFSGAASNKYGFYVIPNVDKGTYIIVFRMLGYETYADQINVTIEDGKVSLSVRLNPASVELEEVVVSEEKIDEVGISTIDISPDILTMLPSFSGELDIFRTLQTLPGVKVANEMSNGLYVRGGSPDQTLTLVDGVIVYNPSHLGNIASTFNSNAVHDIRLIKGAFPAEYGGRLSSVLDIKLRGGTKEKEKGVIGIGNIISHGTIEGPYSENGTYMFSGRVMYYDLYQKNFNTSSTTPRYNFVDLNAKFNHTVDDGEVVSVSLNYSNDNVYNPSASEDFDYNIEWGSSSASINWLKITSGSLLLNASLSYINYGFMSGLNDLNNDSLANDYFSNSTLRDFYIKSNIEYKWEENQTFKSGFEVALHNYDLINRNFYDKSLEFSPDYSENSFSTEAAFYIQNESRFFARLNTNLGLRIYYFQEFKDVKLEPRLSFSFAFTDNILLKGAYSIAHQFLHLITRNDITLPTDLWYPSTANVKPSRSEQFVAGIDTYFGNKEYLFSVEGYYKDMKNLYEFREVLDYDREVPIEDLFTEGEGEAYGVEAFLNKRMGDLTGWIGYTISWTNRLFPHLNAGKVFPPRYDRRHDLSVVLAYKLNEQWSFGVTWVYATGQGYTMPTAQYYFSPQGVRGNREERIQFHYTGRNEYKLPAYHKLDLSTNYKFMAFDLPFEAYLTLYNVYNRQNPFAQYVVYEDETTESGEVIRVPKIKQISLMPFIPTIGIQIKF